MIITLMGSNDPGSQWNGKHKQTNKTCQTKLYFEISNNFDLFFKNKGTGIITIGIGPKLKKSTRT